MPGPAQTPCQFLNGGAAAKFSEKCVAELLKAGYVPEQFGSHEYVKERCNQARARVAQEEAHARDPSNPAPSPPVTSVERQDARCESAHISQNAIHESRRGNQCTTSRTDGYDTSLAPCMPQESSRFGGGPQADHDVGTQHEIDCNRGRRINRTDGQSYYDGMDYPDPPRDQHELDRLRQIADDPDAQARRGGQPYDRAGYTQPSGPPDSGAAAGPGAGEAYSDESFNKPIDGNTAAECINAFKNAAQDAMKAECASQTAANQTAGYGRPKRPGESQDDYERDTRAWRTARTRDYTAASANFQQTSRDQAAATRALTAAQRSGDPAAIQSAQAARTAAVANNNAARQARADAFHAAPNQTGQLGGERSRAAQARCRAAQGERLQAGAGVETTRTPWGGPR